MTNDDKILKALTALQAGQRALQADVATIKTDHGKKLDNLQAGVTILQADVTILKDGQAHNITILKTLDEKIEATKEEVDEIKKRQRPRHAD